jgi:squalene-hopene/tetraprenyl-beta-curcumene cyclase
MPTFCRGWGKLPFDRSAADITAHTIRAWTAWRDELPSKLLARVDAALARAIRYLEKHQLPDGSWLPLWFGNEHEEDDINPGYGTPRVLTAMAECGQGDAFMLRRGLEWLLRAQKDNGGWGGGTDASEASIEETAVAIDALMSFHTAGGRGREVKIDPQRLANAVYRGVAWLTDRTREGTDFYAAPIGFYFAKLWYYERTYPIVWTVAALEKAARLFAAPGKQTAPDRASSAAQRGGEG